jgi:hypothetical protein
MSKNLTALPLHQLLVHARAELDRLMDLDAQGMIDGHGATRIDTICGLIRILDAHYSGAFYDGAGI